MGGGEEAVETAVAMAVAMVAAMGLTAVARVEEGGWRR